MKLIALFAMLVMTTTVGAQDLSYPELHVTPRASKRIKMEIRDEASYAWKSHLPIQLSAATTLVAAMQIQGDTKEDQDMIPKIAMGVSAAWIGATAWAAMSYRPYKAAYLSLKKMKRKSKRDLLTFERMAEEEINSLRSIGTKLKWLSVVTNLAMSSMLISANPNETDDQKGAYNVAGLAGLMAFAPLFFDYRWERVADEQEKYKKKIYAPVAWSPIMVDPTGRNTATGMNLTWMF